MGSDQFRLMLIDMMNTVTISRNSLKIVFFPMDYSVPFKVSDIVLKDIASQWYLWVRSRDWGVVK